MKVKTIPPGLLWEPSTHNDMAPGAVKSAEGYDGPGKDLGELRVGADGFYEILMPKTPKPGDKFNGAWVPFDTEDPTHVRFASYRIRYGIGHSQGFLMHSEAKGLYERLHGRTPTEMERRDLEHDNADYAALVRAVAAKEGTGGGGTKPEEPTAILEGVEKVLAAVGSLAEERTAREKLARVRAAAAQARSAAEQVAAGGAPAKALRTALNALIAAVEA